jgi:hypothetical protein
MPIYLKLKFWRWLALATMGFSLLCPQLLFAWSEYKNTSHMDFDGDQSEELIIETKQGVGLGHYVEDMRIFKDDGSELKLIFEIKTVDEYFIDGNHFKILSDVTFSEPDKTTGLRTIAIASKKIYFKDDENKVISKEESLGTKIFTWNGKTYLEEDKNKDISKI